MHAATLALRLAAAEAGVFACDGAFADLQDAEGFRDEATMAHRLGFVGKSCIHPSQVEIANEVFSSRAPPSSRWRAVSSCRRGGAFASTAAFVVDGKMIDPPFLKRAEALLAQLPD